MRFLALFLSILVLGSCGFSPVYGDLSGRGYGNEDLLATIQVGNIPDREGQMLRNVLIDRLNRKGYPHNPQFILEVEKLTEDLKDLDVTKDSNSTRGQLKLSTGIRLIDTVTKEQLLWREMHAITSYNILASEFATRVSEQNARENAITDLANQIEMQLNLYFKRM